MAFPDYDSDDINYINQKTEITEDLFVYGDTHAQSFNLSLIHI